MTSETIEARAQKAVEMHGWEPNCNCAQSVACSLCDLAGIEPDEAFRAMEGFGAGMGNHQQTCGALSAGVYLIGCAHSDGFNQRTTKAQTRELAASLSQQFADEFGTVRCADLRLNGPDPMANRSYCDKYIKRGAVLAAAILLQEE